MVLEQSHDGTQIKEVYALYGLAMYQAQCVERALAILLATEYGPKPKTITQSQWSDLLDELYGKTLGVLVNKIRQSVTIPDDFEKTLQEALEKRNWLAHRYFWDRAGYFMTSSGREKMIKELTEISSFFDQFDNQLHSIALKWTEKYGISQDTIDDEFEKIVTQANSEVSTT